MATTFRPNPLRNIVVRQQNRSGGWVPRDAWYVMDVDTGECFAWNYSQPVAAQMIPVYEKWPQAV